MVMGCAGPQSRHLSPKTESVILKAWNTGDVSSLNHVLHEELRFTVNGCVTAGRDAYKQRLTRTRAAYEEFAWKQFSRLVDGDIVIAEWRWTGIPKGEEGVSEGKAIPVQVEGVTLSRFEEGLLMEGHQYGGVEVNPLTGKSPCEATE
jgi:hypothetical protein